MLKFEYPYNEDANKIRHYSDQNFMVLQNETGRKFKEAIDVYPTKYTYTETDIPIPPPPPYEETNIPVPAPPEPQPEDELEVSENNGSE